MRAINPNKEFLGPPGAEILTEHSRRSAPPDGLGGETEGGLPGMNASALLSYSGLTGRNLPQHPKAVSQADSSFQDYCRLTGRSTFKFTRVGNRFERSTEFFMKKQSAVDPRDKATKLTDGVSLESQSVSDPSDVSTPRDGVGLGSQLGSNLGEIPAPRDGVSRQNPSPIDLDGVHEQSPDAQKIAQLAYSYWEARQDSDGSPEEDWYRAEQALYYQPSSAEK